MSSLETEHHITQPYQNPQTARNVMAKGSASSLAALLPVSILAQGTSNSALAITRPADPSVFPGSLVLSFQLFWSPEHRHFPPILHTLLFPEIPVQCLHVFHNDRS